MCARRVKNGSSTNAIGTFLSTPLTRSVVVKLKVFLCLETFTNSLGSWSIVIPYALGWEEERREGEGEEEEERREEERGVEGSRVEGRREEGGGRGGERGEGSRAEAKR